MNRSRRQSRMNRRTFIKMSSGALLAVSADWFLPSFSRGAEGEILVGGLCELSGPASIMGTEQARGMELAVEMYNQKGGILGRKIKLLMEDTESKKDVGLAKARRFGGKEQSPLSSGDHLFFGLHGGAELHPGEESSLRKLRLGNDELIRPPYCDRYFFKAPGSFRLTCLAIREPAKRFSKWYFLGDDYSWGRGCVEFLQEIHSPGQAGF